MARYIDADALYEKLYPLDLVDKRLYTINAKAVADAIAKTPTADVVPKSEVAREIFEEIGKILYKHTNIAMKEKSVTCELAIDYIGEDVAELKKKYTEGEK